nr:unnamed protein product [Naegleria fowleri]
MDWLCYMHPIILTDRELVLIAVKQSGEVLQLTNYVFVESNLRLDKEIVLEAIKENKKALLFIPKELLFDYELMLTVLKAIFPEFSHLNSFNYSQKDIMMKLIQENGLFLEFASDALKNDGEFELLAVPQNGEALEYVSDELKRGQQVVLKAVNQCGYSLIFAASELKNNKEVVLKVVRQNGIALANASNELKNDREVVLCAVRQNGYALEFAGDRMRRD